MEEELKKVEAPQRRVRSRDIQAALSLLEKKTEDLGPGEKEAVAKKVKAVLDKMDKQREANREANCRSRSSSLQNKFKELAQAYLAEMGAMEGDGAESEGIPALAGDEKECQEEISLLRVPVKQQKPTLARVKPSQVFVCRVCDPLECSFIVLYLLFAAAGYERRSQL